MISIVETSAASQNDLSPVIHDNAGRKDLVQKALKASSYYAITLLGCEIADGVVVLLGTVPSYHLKQLAQATIMRLGISDRIENQIVVHLP